MPNAYDNGDSFTAENQANGTATVAGASEGILGFLGNLGQVAGTGAQIYRSVTGEAPQPQIQASQAAATAAPNPAAKAGTLDNFPLAGRGSVINGGILAVVGLLIGLVLFRFMRK